MTPEVPRAVAELTARLSARLDEALAENTELRQHVADLRDVNHKLVRKLEKLMAKTPTLTLTLDKPGYDAGDTMTLRATENIGTLRTFAVTDSTGTAWTQAADDGTTATFTATAAKSGAVTVKMNRPSDVADVAAVTMPYTVTVVVEPPSSEMLIGWSMSPNPHPGVCGVARCYDTSGSDLSTAVNTHKVKRLALSSKDDTKSASTVVSRLRSVRSQFPDVEIDYAHENEVDRSDHRGGSTSDINAWCAEHKAIQDAIHAEWPDGEVKTAIDGTSWSARQGNTIKFLNELERIGALPDVLAASMYPAGRKKSPPEESPMSDHIDLWVDFAQQFGIEYVSCWEIGTPLSSNYDRPALVTKWVKRLRDYAESKGIKPRDFLWWDQSIGVDNRFSTDGSTSTVQGKTQKALLSA